jgi:predicted O-methyltransferase YrrM
MPNYGPLIETSLTEREACELQLLALGKRVLEIGAAFGYSATLMAGVAQRVESVDPHFIHNSADAMVRNLRQYGVRDRVVQHVGYSKDVLPKLPAWRFDLVFVDGDHTAAGIGYDLAEAQRLAVPGGVLAFHDWGEDSCPDVRPTLEAWRLPDYVVDTLAIYHL